MLYIKYFSAIYLLNLNDINILVNNAYGTGKHT